MTVIDEALSANKADQADHLNRLKAVERYFDLLQLAQRKLRPVGPTAGPSTIRAFRGRSRDGEV